MSLELGYSMISSLGVDGFVVSGFRVCRDFMEMLIWVFSN